MYLQIDRHLVVDLAKKVASDKSHLLYCSVRKHL